MLIVLSLGVIIVVIAIACIDSSRNKSEKNKFWEILFNLDAEGVFKVIGGVIATLGVIALTVMLIILPINHIGTKASIAGDQERYEALMYKVESGACRDEFGLLNKEVLDEVQDWNEYVVRRKNLQRDFWIGVFYPNIYDQFETIDYEKYGRE